MSYFIRTCLGLIVCLSLLTASIAAVPPSEEIIQKMKNEGTYDEFVQSMKAARAKGVNAPSLNEQGLARASFVDKAATAHTLVILVDFPDKPYTDGLYIGQQSDFEDLLFSEGVIPTGSMREFYLENSYGELTVDGDIAGWYTVSQNHDYYTNFCDGSHGFGSYPNNAQRLTEEALALADPDVDFSQYDVNGDGWVEGVFIVHAGTGYEETGNDCEVHSHKWGVNAVQRDGVWISTYSMEPEESPSSSGLIPIGVFCHEFGHVLGLPDLYDYDYDSRGTGRWAVMSGGSYNNSSRTPAAFCAWSKYQMGWVDPVNVTSDMVSVDIPATEWNKAIYRLWPNGIISNEYFLVENKQPYGYDTYLPGHGLLIYHIDDNASSNSEQWHPIVMVEQADGDFDLQYNVNSGDVDDPYPGGLMVKTFDETTMPNSNNYDGIETMVSVFNISDSDSIMTVDFRVEITSPYYRIQDYSFSDAAYGDGDGILEPGETVQFFLAVKSEWSDVTNVELSLSSDDPELLFTKPAATLGTFPAGLVVNNTSEPIEFEIPVDYAARIDSFFITFSTNDGQYFSTFAVEENIGGNRILLVDDDNGDTYEDYFLPSLSDKRITHTHWDVTTSGSVSASVMNNYNTVVWFTGDYQTNPLSSADITALESFMDAGGNLFMSGQGIAAQLTTLNPSFLSDYLHAGYTSSSMVPFMLPDAGGLVLNDFDTLVIQSFGSAGNQTSPDHLTAVNGGVVEARYFGSGDPSAVSYAGVYKSMFFGFGFEGLGDNEERFARRSAVLDSLLVFFGEYSFGPEYIAGDANGDTSVNVGDAVYLVNYIFKGGPGPVPEAAGDANGDCSVNIGDAVHLVNYIFNGGAAPQFGCD
ncbi:MAG: M6 family metalloprotease domain-containing protein [Candidatus Zixiibacteriota bacterium]